MLRRTLHIWKKAKKIHRSLRGRSQHLRSWLVLICAVTEQSALLMSFVTSQGADFRDSFREDFLKREGFFSSFLRTKTKMNAGIGKGGGVTVAGPLILTLFERKNLILRFLNALPFFIRLPSPQLFTFSLVFFLTLPVGVVLLLHIQPSVLFHLFMFPSVSRAAAQTSSMLPRCPVTRPTGRDCRLTADHQRPPESPGRGVKET